MEKNVAGPRRESLYVIQLLALSRGGKRGRRRMEEEREGWNLLRPS